MAKASCSVEGCERLVSCRGWCKLHYDRWAKCGDPGEAAPRQAHYPWPENLLRRLRFMPSGCIEFTGVLDRHGYGRTARDGRTVGAHRAAYELVHGPVAQDLDLDHLCRNRACVNPAHLEPVSRQENLLRGDTIPAAYARRTHCKHGHLYDEANTRVDERGGRRCRACHAASTRRWRAAKAG